MTELEIYEKISREFPGAVTEIVSETKMPQVVVQAASLTVVMRTLKDDPEISLDFLSSISGVDSGDKIAVVYHLFSYSKKHRFVVKVYLGRDKPEVPSVTDIWAGANWHERETHEFFGIKFEGHPYLVPLLLPEDADFHPLLKDFTP